MKTLIIRSREDAQNTADTLEKKGIKTETLPIFSVEYYSSNIGLIHNIDPKTIDGVVITSTKAIRSIENTSKAFKNIQIFSVGERTTEKLKETGFNKIKTGAGTALELEDTIKKFYKNKQDISLAYISGEKVSYNFDLLENDNIYKLKRYIVYKTIYIDELPTNIINSLKTGDISKVIILSQNIAEKFVELVHKAGLSETCSSVKAYTLTESIKSVLEQIPFSAIKVPKKPRLSLIIKKLEKRKKYKKKIISVIILIIILIFAVSIGYYKFSPNTNSIISNIVNSIIPQDIFHRNITDKVNKTIAKHTKNLHSANDNRQLETDNKLTETHKTITPTKGKMVDKVINDENKTTTEDNKTLNTNQATTNNQDNIDNDKTIIDVTPSDNNTDDSDSNTNDSNINSNNTEDIKETNTKITHLENEISSLKSRLQDNETIIKNINKKALNDNKATLNNVKNLDSYTSYTILLMIRQDVLSGRSPKSSIEILKKVIHNHLTNEVKQVLTNLSKINAETPQLPKLAETIFDLSYNGVVDYTYNKGGLINHSLNYIHKIIKVKHKTFKTDSVEYIINKIRIQCLNNNYKDVNRLFNLLPKEIKITLYDWHNQAQIAINNLQDIDYLQKVIVGKLNK